MRRFSSGPVATWAYQGSSNNRQADSNCSTACGGRPLQVGQQFPRRAPGQVRNLRTVDQRAHQLAVPRPHGQFPFPCRLVPLGLGSPLLCPATVFGLQHRERVRLFFDPRHPPAHDHDHHGHHREKRQEHEQPPDQGSGAATERRCRHIYAGYPVEQALETLPYPVADAFHDRFRVLVLASGHDVLDLAATRVLEDQATSPNSWRRRSRSSASLRHRNST